MTAAITIEVLNAMREAAKQARGEPLYVLMTPKLYRECIDDNYTRLRQTERDRPVVAAKPAYFAGFLIRFLSSLRPGSGGSCISRRITSSSFTAGVCGAGLGISLGMDISL